jgi:hypothetical protein
MKRSSKPEPGTFRTPKFRKGRDKVQIVKDVSRGTFEIEYIDWNLGQNFYQLKGIIGSYAEFELQKAS